MNNIFSFISLFHIYKALIFVIELRFNEYCYICLMKNCLKRGEKIFRLYSVAIYPTSPFAFFLNVRFIRYSLEYATWPSNIK